MQRYNNLHATVNGEFTFTVEDLQRADLIPVSENTFHLLLDGQSIAAEVLERDYQRKLFVIKINGTRYEVQLSDELDQMIERLGLGKRASTAIDKIKAPMPGLVRQVLVAPGDEIHVGQPVLILEAMKMENVIKAPGDGRVKTLRVGQGAAVDKNQVLIELE